jgi:hypothetical protein
MSGLICGDGRLAAIQLMRSAPALPPIKRYCSKLFCQSCLFSSGCTRFKDARHAGEIAEISTWEFLLILASYPPNRLLIFMSNDIFPCTLNFPDMKALWPLISFLAMASHTCAGDFLIRSGFLRHPPWNMPPPLPIYQIGGNSYAPVISPMDCGESTGNLASESRRHHPQKLETVSNRGWAGCGALVYLPRPI